MIPAYWPDAQAHLAAADPVLAKLIAQYGHEGGLVSRGDPFETLARSIVGQQISVKAAASVWQRVTAAFDITPAALARAEEAPLRACGLSRQKVRYLTGIAQAFVAGDVHPAQWSAWEDEAVIAELVQLPGVGRWTAEMFLMFHLLRPDVLPLKDLGILTAFERYYGQPRDALAVHATRWQPYRTVACWYLWRALDNAPTNY